MSNSDTMTEQQKREEKVDPNINPDELAEGDFHIAELGQACKPGSESDDLESIDSEDEEKERPYDGKMYKGKELLD
eukprot:951605-Prymnesium_polylepis.1